MPIESASRFSSACVSSSIQWRSSKITISGWLSDSRIRMRLIASSVRRFRDLRVHLRERVVAFDDSEQRKQIRKRVFERAIERRASSRSPSRGACAYRPRI